MKTFIYKVYDKTQMRIISRSTKAYDVKHANNKIRLIEDTNDFEITYQL